MGNEDIVFSVGGDVTALKRGMDKGSRDVKKFGNITRADLKRTAARFAKFGAAASAAAIAAGAVFARSALKSADAIRKLSIRTGVATDALQELQHAYNLAGVDQKKLNNGLEVFGKRLGKARDGFGALKEGLRGSNDQLLQTILASDNTTEALNKVFEAMGNATSEAQRLAIADAAFGGVGLKMTSAFENGAEAFDKARQEAHDLGLVLSEDLLKNAEKLNDDFAKASGIIRTQLAAAFLELAPAISKSVTELVSFLQELRGIEAIMKRIREQSPLVVEFNDVNNAISQTRAEMKKVRDMQFGGRESQKSEKLIELQKTLVNLLQRRETLVEQITSQKQAEIEAAKNVTKETEKQRDAEKKILDNRQTAANIGPERRPGSPNRGDGGGMGRQAAFNIQTARVMGEGDSPVARSIQMLTRFVTRTAGNVGDVSGAPGTVNPFERAAAFNRGAGDIPQGRVPGSLRGQFGMDPAAGGQFGGRALEGDITAQKIEAIKERFKTMEELEVERFEREQALLEERMATETEKQQEHLELLEKLQKEHGKNMADIREDKAKREQAIEKQNRLMLVAGAQNLISEIGRINDDMFRQAQIAGAALAMVNALVAASEILKNTSTWDFTAGVKATAAALQVLATGIGFVNAIKSTKPGGGGAVVGAGGVPSTPTAEQGEPTRNVFINVRGASRDTRAAIEAINEEIKDGSKLAGISAS